MVKLSWQWKFALLLIGLIVIPGIMLAYFSVQAIESERVAYEQRIRESYLRLARFAEDEFYDQFEVLSDRWIQQLRPTIFVDADPAEQQQLLIQMIAEDPLVDAAFLVQSDGDVVFPKSLHPGAVRLNAPEAESLSDLDEWLQKFRRLSELAEEFEFNRSMPDSALAIFHKIEQDFPVPRLRAIALSEISRIHLYRAEWKSAYETSQRLIRRYPQARDLNNLHLRFYAKFVCVNTLENMQLMDEAMPALLDLYQDLLDNSDEVNRVQYEFFLERIQQNFKKLIGAYTPDEQAHFRSIYQNLQERKKKSIGETYIVEKLYQRLNKAILKRNNYRPKFKYFSDFAVEQPYLVAYLLMSENENFIVRGALGLEINLAHLREQLFPQILSLGDFPSDVTIGILDQEGSFVLGDAEKIISRPAAVQQMRDPLDFWQLALYPTLENPLLSGGDQWLYLKLWGIFALWLAMMTGAGVIVYNLRKQQRLSMQKTTFVSSITHELRTPLTSIKMFSEFLSKNTQLQDDPEAKKYLRIIRTESDRLSRLVDNVLDFARFERGDKQYQLEYEEPEAIIRSVVDTFNYQSDVSGIEIQLELPDELPEVLVDRNAISQALINLIGNAIKYSPDKKPVTVRASQNGKYVNIDVQDRGIGIKRQHLKKIFDDYYRANDKAAANIAGTGLGLPLVKRIAEAHHGAVTVESSYGEGSVFTLKLPISE